LGVLEDHWFPIHRRTVGGRWRDECISAYDRFCTALVVNMATTQLGAEIPIYALGTPLHSQIMMERMQDKNAQKAKTTLKEATDALRCILMTEPSVLLQLPCPFSVQRIISAFVNPPLYTLQSSKAVTVTPAQNTWELYHPQQQTSREWDKALVEESYPRIHWLGR